MIKILQTVLMVIATILMGALVLIMRESSIIDLVAPGYFIVVNAFLGLDLVIMIKETKKLPPAAYKDMHMYRYITALLCMMALSVLTIYMEKVYDIHSFVAISSFSLGTFTVIGLILGGLKGNKLAAM